MLCEISEESLMTSSGDYALQHFTAKADWFEQLKTGISKSS